MRFGNQYQQSMEIEIPSNAEVEELKKQIMESYMGHKHKLEGRPCGVIFVPTESEDDDEVVDEILCEKGKRVWLVKTKRYRRLSSIYLL